jgi:PPP family 3-phenylpropionic acid transporter
VSRHFPARSGESGISPVALLSAYWFLVMGAIGVYFSYFSLYLKENLGLPGSQVGIVLATIPLVGIVAQPLWGQVADRSGKRTGLIALLAVGATLGYLGLILPTGFGTILIGAALLAVFSTSLVPMGVSVSMALLSGKGIPDFGRVRVWGTLGYLLTAVATPRLLHYLQDAKSWVPEPGGPPEPGLEFIFILAALCTLGAGIVAWRLPRGGSVALQAARGDWRVLLHHGPFLRVLVFSFGSFFFTQGQMVLFPIYIRSLGGDMEAVSHMWIWMIFLEIPLVFFASRIFERVGPKVMVAGGAFAAGLRWTACGLITDLTWIYPIQLLHGFVIVGLLVAAPLYVECLVPPALRSTGQALLIMVGVAVGGILSTFICGMMLDHFDTEVTLLFGGVGGIAMGVFGLWFLPDVPKK